MILFTILLFEFDSGWASIIDDGVMHAFGDVSFLAACRFLGSELVLGGGAVLLILFLFWKRNMGGITAILIGVGGGNLLNKALKEWIARERPPFPHREDGFSFVSGHAMVGIIFYLLFAYFMSFYAGKTVIFYTAALMLGFLSGMSRVADNAHYATDVLAGWLLGGGVFLFIAFFLNRQIMQQANRKSYR
ncbi:phosphatase PAP2 family protein [Domibacillus sp. A3M-37]|uniref:phosphatase PAP2 family protein n=1 Tax=Domibacillus TaxID=1433999 RepID=UPI0020B644F6|nr:phosphatase PAP2 family protein [Domibacillus sp. A3M-37]MCP3761606.1 phosphatase PAP2 family protein [Domibacillus sp. A3M-37]